MLGSHTARPSLPTCNGPHPVNPRHPRWIGTMLALLLPTSRTNTAPTPKNAIPSNLSDDFRGYAAEDPTYVHLQPITVVDVKRSNETVPPSHSDIDYRFSARDDHNARQAVLAALSTPFRHKKRLKRFEMCGSHATIWHSATTDQIKILAYHCGLRICPRCREMHAARTRDILGRFLQTVDANRLSMVTLTLVHSDLPLADQLDHLYASFRRLRASKTWRVCKAKGYAVLEISRSSDGLQWHPHLHLLADMPYCPHDKLKAAWLLATHDSSIVDIRRINSHAVQRHQAYLTNYLSKPPTDAIQSDARVLGEWIDALCSRRVLLKFGRPSLADKPAADPPPDDWRLIGTLLGLLRAMELGDPDATHWLKRIGSMRCLESRNPDAGKDYSIDPAYRTDDRQFY